MKCLFSHYLFIFWWGVYTQREIFENLGRNIFPFISEDAKKISAHQVVLGTF